jgi:hypothetical protein
MIIRVQNSCSSEQTSLITSKRVREEEGRYFRVYRSEEAYRLGEEKYGPLCYPARIRSLSAHYSLNMVVKPHHEEYNRCEDLRKERSATHVTERPGASPLYHGW